MTLAALDLLARVKPALTPLRQDARGLRVEHRGAGLRMPIQPPAPLLAQTVSHASNAPFAAQRLKDLYTVNQCGNDFGSRRQAQPVRST